MVHATTMLIKRLLFISLFSLTTASIIASFEFSSTSYFQLAPILDIPLLFLTSVVVSILIYKKRKTTSFIALLILQFIVLFYRNTDAHFQAEETEASIRILSLNVQQFNNDTSTVNSIVKMINDHQPDIVLLQEFGLYYRWPDVESVASDFARRINMPHHHFEPKKVDIFGVATFSKFSFESSNSIFRSSPSTNEAHEIILNTGKERIMIVNYHLESYNIFPIRDNDSLYSPSSVFAKQRDQAGLLLRKEGDHLPLILAGDLNAVPGSRTYCEFGFEYTNAQSAFGQGLISTLKNTWLRLDHIWINEKWVINDLKVNASFPSDHKAIIADLRLLK